MRKQTISSSELRLLMFLVSLLLIAGSYFLVFQNMTSKAQELEAQNVTDAQKVQQLELMAARRAIVEQQTEDLQNAIEVIVSRYPSAIPQDKVNLIIQDMEDQTGIHVDAIGFMMDALIGNIYTANADTPATDETAVDEAAADGAATDVTDPTADVENQQDAAPAENVPAQDAGTPCGFYNSITLSFRTDYEGFKKIALYAVNATDRMTIPEISVSFDKESGELTGTMTMNLYYLTNTGREYTAPSITGTASKGVSDIFRTAGGANNDTNGGEE